MGDYNKVVSALMKTWPARLAQDAWNAVKLPGDVYQGNVSVTGPDGNTSPDVISRAADLAGLVTMGAAAAPPMRNAAGMGIRAYHGSPYDFDRFDLSKVGTGEGAQSYGHGMYFAENPKVAQEYRRSLTPKADSPHQWLADAIREAGESGASKWLDARHSEVARQGFGGELEASAIREAMSMMRAGQVPNPKGRIYEVNINSDPQHFLDWDKPNAAQSELVKNALKKVGLWGEREIAEAASLPQTSEALRNQGVAGYRYLDQGSRNLGDGTRNYVVFNDKLIDILKKYSLAGTTAGGLGGSELAEAIRNRKQAQPAPQM